MKDLPRTFDLTDQTAIVTGGAGLLGAEFCRTLAEAGALVVVADIQREAAKKIASSINDDLVIPDRGGNISAALAVEVDVTSPDSVRRLVDVAVETFGRLDILVNSAALDPKLGSNDFVTGGIRNVSNDNEEFVNEDLKRAETLSLSFEDYPLELWNQAIAVNLTGMFLCCQAAVKPMMAQGKGSIVNLCSIYGLVGPDQRVYQRGGEPAQYKPVYYSVTKAGVLGLTRYLATYYAGKGIRVNSLAPGGVFDGHDPAFVEAYSVRTPLGRMAEKDEMNGALLFLASGASAYMTGANLVVDGGWSTW